MPHWTTDPPADADPQPFRILRTPPTGKLIAIITARDVLGCNTHFYNHRTTPCDGDECIACSEGYPWRWHGYVTAVDVLSREHFLFEFPAAACDPIRAYRENHTTLRGCTFLATRAPQRPNGRVMIRCKPADLERESLPPEPNVKAILCKLWGIALPKIETTGRSKGAERVEVAGNHRSKKTEHTTNQH
jgi:hypothetical protein